MSEPHQPSSAQRTLLVVDDQHGVRVSLSFLLGTAGYKVLTVDSGHAAVAMFESESVDGVIIDVHMPAMNGFDTCIALQQSARMRGRQLRVWFMTGAFTSGAERRCAELGGIGVFRKPFQLPETLEQLEAGFFTPPPQPAAVPTALCVPANDTSGNHTSHDGGQ